MPQDVVRTCLDIAQQAPSGSNNRAYRWIVVRDPDRRRRLADVYRLGLGEYARATAELEQRGFEGRVDADPDGARTRARDAQTRRVFASARHLTEHLHEVPVLVVPCLLGRLPDAYDNFRGRGVLRLHPPGDLELHAGAARPRATAACTRRCTSCTKREAAAVLGIPDHVTQVGLIPVAPFLGEDFRPAERGPIDEIVRRGRLDVRLTAEPIRGRAG